jgi:GNAT superfamily N-acetyltransferase
VKVRAFEAADSPACCSIAQRNWREVLAKVYSPAVVERYASGYVPQQFTAHASRHDVQVIVAEGPKGVAGFITLHVPPGSARAEIWRMFVDPGMRGKGYGKALMGATEEYLRARAVRWVYVESAILPETVGFYGRLGFSTLGEGLQGDAPVVKMEKEL